MTIARVAIVIVFYLLISYGVLKANIALIGQLDKLLQTEKLMIFLLWPLINMILGVMYLFEEMLHWWESK